MSAFAGKRILITGGASGIGRATAEAAVKKGARVVIADIDEANGREAAEDIGAAFLRIDVAEEDNWREAAQVIKTEIGGLDILHLNAGRMLRPAGAPALVGDQMNVLTPERYRAVMAVNCDGVIFGILTLLPLLRKSDDAKILITSSATGLAPFAADPIYAMSKHAITGLVRSLAPSLANENIKLMAVCPAGIETAMTPPDIREHYETTSGFATSAYAACAIEHILAVGAAGDNWVIRSTDPGIWAYPFFDLPSPLPDNIEQIRIRDGGE